jgi:signal transduction histidine kinase
MTLMVTETLNEAMDGSAEPDAATFPQILDQCVDSAILAVDDSGRIVAFTEQTARLTGVLAEKAIHQSLNVLPSPLAEILDRTLSTKRPIPDRQILLPSTENGELSIRISTTPMVNLTGACIGVVAVLNNLTPARHLDLNLRRMDRLASIGTLSASMAHEVKNAMVAIKTFVDLLIKKNQDSSLAEIVGREMRRIDSIVSQMLRFAGPARPTFGIVHLHDVLDHSLNLVQHHLEGRNVKLTRSFDASPDTVRGDTYQLEQAFINLLFNALEAMGAHGEISVSTELVPPGGPENPRAPLLRVSIRDTGVGIAPENLARLFKPFFTTKPNGTGLGLAITQRIVQEHHGLISASSEAQKGTTFTLRLPAAGRHP